MGDVIYIRDKLFTILTNSALNLMTKKPGCNILSHLNRNIVKNKLELATHWGIIRKLKLIIQKGVDTVTWLRN